jgi:hypothetical protein
VRTDQIDARVEDRAQTMSTVVSPQLAKLRVRTEITLRVAGAFRMTDNTEAIHLEAEPSSPPT